MQKLFAAVFFGCAVLFGMACFGAVIVGIAYLAIQFGILGFVGGVVALLIAMGVSYKLSDL